MKHTEYFNNFLKSTVNLSQFDLDVLEDRVDSVYGALKKDLLLGPRIITKIPQGSWAQRTIIDPQSGKAFDADFLLKMREEPDWSATPQEYLNAVYRALDGHSTYGAMPHGRKCRCVYLEYANNEMHIDVVPYVVLSDGRQVIVNRDQGVFETTNPSGFTQWMKEKDSVTGGNLRKVIRLVKFLRDHKNSFTGTRSILLTALLGGQVQEWKTLGDAGYYADVPTALLHIVGDLDTWLQANCTKPTVVDPSNTAVNFDHRWTQETYSYFRDRLHVHAEQIRTAYDEVDGERSVELWQGLFGARFQAPTPVSSSTKFGDAGLGGGAGLVAAPSTGRSGRAG